MSEILLKWLNNDIHLSKEIKEISEDFKNGYLFAELLHKMKYIQNLSQFKDSNNKKDIIHNFCFLNKTLLDMGIILNEKDRNEIMNGGLYAAKIYLLKIRQVLDKKNIDLEQLKFKYSNDLQLLYNKMVFKNQNERYLYNIKNKLDKENNKISLKNTRSMTEGKLDDGKLLDIKYSVEGPIYNQLKKKYSHLGLSDFDFEIILLDMKDQEIKLNYLKEKVKKTEKARAKLCLSKEKKEINNWKSSIIKIRQNKDNLLKEFWEPALRYQKASINYFKKNALNNVKITRKFDNELNFFAPEKNAEEYDEENQEEMKKLMKLKNDIYMRQIKEKMENKIKSKKDKEKRERKRLKEELEIYERMTTEKNMSDMIKNMENNINKKANISIKGDELIAKTEKMMNSLSPTERQRVQYLDRLINKEIDKENRIDEKINISYVGKTPKVNMNITKLLDLKKTKEKEKNEKINEIEENEEKKEIQENEEKKEENEENEEKNNETANQYKSSYSKLTENDYGLNPINDTFKIHSKDININDRIKLFKTRLMYNQETDKKLPDLPEILVSEENDTSKKQKSETNILQKSTNINDNNNNIINAFDKESFYEEMNKINYDNFKKQSDELRIKKEKKKKLIKPIINKIVDIAEYISIYQENKGVQLVDNSKWDEIMEKFINWEDLYEHEEEEIINQDEESEYLFEYGEKVTSKDNLIIFDYINYLNIFNDLIIPTSLRGKQYKYYELYDEVYNSLNNDVDIKEYEPKEDEVENLKLPKTPNFYNFRFYDIIENCIKTKYNKNQKKNIINNDIFSQKGKYFYIPIKMSIVGYPMSGKKIQSNLITEKYPHIKIFDPEVILEQKLEEYKELKEPVEKTTKSKTMKQNQLEQMEKERQEKLEKFNPILEIIKPYLDYQEKYDKEKISYLNESNYKDNLMDELYINLLIYEIDKAYPDDKESKNKFLEDINESYKQYISIKEQIEEIKKNDEENKKEQEEKGNKNKKTASNFSKDLENLNKQLESIIPSLYVGFIFINFPKNVNQAKKLENKITGYISEFEKPKDLVEEKLFGFNNILDIHIKQNKNNSSQISMFDLFINLNITSEEVEHRFKNTKYDPNTKKVYNMEVNPPSDKKIIEKLLPGKPNYDKDRISKEKEFYEKSIYNLVNFYKIMTNGNQKIYKNIDQMDKAYIQKINSNIENSMKEIIFSDYLKSIELIINNINKKNEENNVDSEKEKEKGNEKGEIKNEEKGEVKNEEKEKGESKNEENEKKEDENLSSPKKEENKINISNIEKKPTFSNIKEIKSEINNLTEEISNQFENYASNYKNSLINFIHFIDRQKEHIILYLTKIQNDFVLYLNRKTDKTNIAEIYINKYNSIIKNHPNLMNNPKVYNDMLQDIEDVGKSIWLSIQNKKNEDVKYLKDRKEEGRLDNELLKFWEYSLLLIEAEVKKYLLNCEVIIKYYLNQTGLLTNILGIFESNIKINKNDEFLFKIDHSKYLFKGIEIPEALNILIKKNIETIDANDINEEKTNENIIENNNDKKGKENEIIMGDENEGENNDKNEINKQNDKNKNTTKSFLNKTQKSNSTKKEITLEEKLDIIFLNSIKIIIRQDLLNKKYKEKLRTISPTLEREFKKNSASINKLVNSSISSRSSQHKSKANKITKGGIILYEEELSNQIRIEKLKFKYRLMFLKYFILKYYNIIKECFNNAYNAMDDWIIMSVRAQNNSLNEFTFYLKKLLTKSNKEASLEDFEFDTFDIYRRYKVDISFIFEKIKLNSIVNLKKKKEQKKNEIILINENEMPYLDKYVYNIEDLMEIYNYLKSFGTEGCEYLVKYEIVKEILIHNCFSKKKYGDLSNINNDISNSESDANSVEINNNNSSENNNSINLFKSKSLNNMKIFEENNGIPKIILFLSNINYINCLNKFSEYENKYININKLFTSLILMGSELITSETFLEILKEELPENKEKNNNLKHILLSKEEFLDLKLWFDNDKYLNAFVDEKEEQIYKEGKGNKREDNKNSNTNTNTKIKKIKNSIFEINEEEGKIDLYKIIELLDKFNGKEKEVIKEKEENNPKDENIINEEKKEDIKSEETKKDIIEEEKNKKDNNNIDDKEKVEFEKENKEISKVEGDEDAEKKEEKNEEKEGGEKLEKKEEKIEEDEDKSDKESIKNDEASSNQNESDILASPKNKKNKNKKDEVVNNIFNAIFLN